MTGGQLIREARKRAALSQRELARLSGTSQPAIARYESGAADPAFGTLKRIIAACGMDLGVNLYAHDDHDLGLAVHNLRLTPERRLDQLVGFLRFAKKLRTAKRVGRAS